MPSTPKYDDRTPRGWPLPHWLNKLDIDSLRIRETITQIDWMISKLEKDSGNTAARLDSIVGGTTEDSEILDARVDAKNEIHPNLGDNLRSIHKLALGFEADILHIAAEFKGLLRQFNDLVYAQAQGELNAIEANQRRISDIQQEEEQRYRFDSGLQGQIDTLSFAHMDWVLSTIEARENILTKISEINEAFTSLNKTVKALYDAMADTGVMTYKGARIAPSYEITEMLNDILAGTDDGEISVSVIPDEVKDEIADSQEVREIIEEVFPNRS